MCFCFDIAWIFRVPAKARTWIILIGLKDRGPILTPSRVLAFSLILQYLFFHSINILVPFFDVAADRAAGRCRTCFDQKIMSFVKNWDPIYVKTHCVDVVGTHFEGFYRLDLIFSSFRHLLARLSNQLSCFQFNRAEGHLHVQERKPRRDSPCTGCSVRAANLPGRVRNHLHGQNFEKLNLLIYWFQRSGITYPTLQMIKSCP